MGYTKHGDRVTLEMTQDDYENLLLLLGYGTGPAKRNGDNQLFWAWLGLVNRLNSGNPNYTPYEIPAEFAEKPR